MPPHDRSERALFIEESKAALSKPFSIEEVARRFDTYGNTVLGGVVSGGVTLGTCALNSLGPLACTGFTLAAIAGGIWLVRMLSPERKQYRALQHTYEHISQARLLRAENAPSKVHQTNWEGYIAASRQYSGTRHDEQTSKATRSNSVGTARVRVPVESEDLLEPPEAAEEGHLRSPS